jgi:beta-glucanase (GH16 family)
MGLLLLFRCSRVESILGLAAFWLAAASVGNAQCGGVPTSVTGSVTWTAQWCDEFSGALNSPINSANWTFDTGSSGFGNNELEYYCDPSSNTAPCSTSSPNAFIDGSGHLAIQVRGPANSNCTPAGTCTSARLKTQGLQTFNSGRIEGKLQFPSHTGLWPAFWMLGSQPGVSWPTVGESDIMENWPATSNINGPGATGNCSTIHTQITGGSGNGKCFTLLSGGQVDSVFHTYGQIWSANMLQFYIDDPTQPYFVVTASDLPAGDSWPFSSPNNPFFLIMNMAVGGTLGAPTDAQTASQAPLLADYVRQYTPSQIPAPVLAQPAAITVSAGATSGNSSTLNLTGTQGSGRVTFACTTTAPKASCIVTSTDAMNVHTVDFSNASSASATVTVTTTYLAKSAGISGAGSWLGISGAIVLAFLASGVKRNPIVNGREIRAITGLVSLTFAISVLLACGGGYGGGGGGGGGGGRTGTPAGNYSITVKAYTVSSTDTAVPSATTTFNLTVN